MRRTDLAPGQLVLTADGHIGVVKDVWDDGQWKYAKVEPKHLGDWHVQTHDELTALFALTQEQFHVLRDHTTRHTVFYRQQEKLLTHGRSCPCHGIFQVAVRTLENGTDEFYAFGNLSGVKNVLYLDGGGAGR